MNTFSLTSLTVVFLLFSVAAQADWDSTGAKLYRDCAACHGRDGGGVIDGSVPAIGGQPAEVVRRQLQSFRRGARTDLRMQHFSNNDHLAGDEAVEAVSRYVAGLQRVMPPATGSGRALDAGQQSSPAVARAVMARGGRRWHQGESLRSPVSTPVISSEKCVRRPPDKTQSDNLIGRSSLEFRRSAPRRSPIGSRASRFKNPASLLSVNLEIDRHAHKLRE